MAGAKRRTSNTAQDSHGQKAQGQTARGQTARGQKPQDNQVVAAPSEATVMRFPRGEIAVALVWLSIGAVISVLLEVVYLGTWWTVPGGLRIPAPWTILVAFFFTRVLSRTALLWTKRLAIAAIPAWVWLLGYLSLTFLQPVTGDILFPSDVRSILLLLAGLAGGAWPLVAATFPHPTPETNDEDE